MNLISLSQELVEAIFQHLIEKPYKEVAHLIAPLQAQVASHIQASQNAPSASLSQDNQTTSTDSTANTSVNVPSNLSNT